MGTFGSLLNNQGNFDNILGSDKNITVNVGCAQRQLF
jgi:hypothetical protein